MEIWRDARDTPTPLFRIQSEKLCRNFHRSISIETKSETGYQYRNLLFPRKGKKCNTSVLAEQTYIGSTNENSIRKSFELRCILIFLRSQVLALLFTVHFHLNINIYFLRKVMNDDKY